MWKKLDRNNAKKVLFCFVLFAWIARSVPSEDAAAHAEGVPRLAAPHCAGPAVGVLARPVHNLTLLAADKVVGVGAGCRATLLGKGPAHALLGGGARGSKVGLILGLLRHLTRGRGLVGALDLCGRLCRKKGGRAGRLVVGLGLEQRRNVLRRLDEPRARFGLPLAASGLDVLLHVKRLAADRPASRALSDDHVCAHFCLLTSTSLDRSRNNS